MIKPETLLLKIPHDQPVSIAGWQIVYSGFIMMLLCFFIMLTSFASLEESKITRFARSFTSAVSVFNGGRSLEPGINVVENDTVVTDKADRIALLFEQVKQLNQLNGLDPINVTRSPRGIIMTLADKMLFQSGDAALSESAYPLLKKISAVINKIDAQVDIEGHTDDRPIRTDRYPSNWELSTARAVNVLRYLITEGKVSAQRLSAVGLSKHHPIAPNSSAANRAKNRRVEIIFRPERL